MRQERPDGSVAGLATQEPSLVVDLDTSRTQRRNQYRWKANRVQPCPLHSKSAVGRCVLPPFRAGLGRNISGAGFGHFLLHVMVACRRRIAEVSVHGGKPVDLRTKASGFFYRCKAKGSRRKGKCEARGISGYWLVHSRRFPAFGLLFSDRLAKVPYLLTQLSVNPYLPGNTPYTHLATKHSRLNGGKRSGAWI